jgi:hypothetical protein
MADGMDEARRKIEQRLDELHDEAERLNRALVHLAGTSSTKASGKAKPRKRAVGKPRAKRGQRVAEMLEDVKRHPGAKPSESAKRIGISAGQALGLALRLKRSGQFVPQGDGYVVRNRPARGKDT